MTETLTAALDAYAAVQVVTAAAVRDVQGRFGDAAQAARTLAAVVEPHRPVRRRVTFVDSAGKDAHTDLGCQTCTPYVAGFGTDVWWPCPTFRAIADGLGIK